MKIELIATVSTKKVVKTRTKELIVNVTNHYIDLLEDNGDLKGNNTETTQGLLIRLASIINEIRNGNIADLFKDGMTFILLPDLMDYEHDIIDETIQKIIVIDRNFIIQNEDLQF
jgi:hypothetical protein